MHKKKTNGQVDRKTDRRTVSFDTWCEVLSASEVHVCCHEKDEVEGRGRGEAMRKA